MSTGLLILVIDACAAADISITAALARNARRARNWPITHSHERGARRSQLGSRSFLYFRLIGDTQQGEVARVPMVVRAVKCSHHPILLPGSCYPVQNRFCSKEVHDFDWIYLQL